MRERGDFAGSIKILNKELAVKPHNIRILLDRFGYAAALPSRVMIGMMALTIDFDHLLNVVGLVNVTRLAHSIPFAIMSCILMGVFVSRFFKWSSRTAEWVTPWAPSYSKEIRYNKDQNSIFTDSIFSQFLIITLIAFLSHIAFDALQI